MRQLLCYIFLLNFLFSKGQEPVINFSDAVRVNLSEYKAAYVAALDAKNHELAQFLFDSLVNEQLLGTKFNYLSLKRVDNPRIKLKKIKKPIALITHCHWMVKNRGEIQAINKIAREYHNKMTFIVLYYDTKEDALKPSRKFNKHVIVCHAHDKNKYDLFVVKTLRNTLGFPNLIVMDENKIIHKINRGTGVHVDLKTPLKKAKDLNYEYYKKEIAPMIQRIDSINESKRKRKGLFFKK